MKNLLGSMLRNISLGLCIKSVLILACVIIYFVYSPELVDASILPFVHPFFHANLAHLFINCFAISVIYKNRQHYKLSTILVAYIIAVASCLVLCKNCIGISNVIYAVLGMRFSTFEGKWYKSPNMILFFALMVVMCFIPVFSGLTHITSFMLGLGYAHLVLTVQKYSRC